MKSDPSAYEIRWEIEKQKALADSLRIARDSATKLHEKAESAHLLQRLKVRWLRHRLCCVMEEIDRWKDWEEVFSDRDGLSIKITQSLIESWERDDVSESDTA
jgi:hypothetical protein